MLQQVLSESKQSLRDEDLPILAIDYGDRRIGIAVSDLRGSIASPITTIKWTKGKKLETVLDEILAIADEYQTRSFLLGVPYAFEEQHNEIQVRIAKFSEKLSLVSKKKIYYHTESYSSKEASSLLDEAGMTEGKGRVDKISAALFLQEFIDGKHRK